MKHSFNLPADQLLPTRMLSWLAEHELEAEVRITGESPQPLRNELDKEVELSSQSLEGLYRLAATAEVSASMAHELRNVLTGIVGLCQLRPTERSEIHNELLKDEASRCLALLENYLPLTQTAAEVALPLRAEDVLSATRLILSHKANSMGVGIEVEVPRSLPPLLAKPHALRQVLLNLGLNAIQSVGKAGRVRLQAGEQGGMLLLSVHDNGPGIAPRISETLFSPFVTTRSHRGGTGLGLSTARDLVRAMGGELTGTTPRTGGACFEVLLPQAKLLTVAQPSDDAESQDE